MGYEIRTFRGFGSAERLYVSGQVARSVGRTDASAPPRSRRGRLARLRDAFKLALTPRLPGCRLRVSCAGVVTDTVSDSHGHFEATLAVEENTLETPWQRFQVELLDGDQSEPVRAEGLVLTAGPGARRIIVSDVDDTIIYTGVANKARMLWRLFAQSAEQRVPFPGIDAFFRALSAGATGEENNPVIYLSRGPWSIYPILEEFLALHSFPSGFVLLLREWGVTWRHPFPRRARWHKARLLSRVFAAFPGHRLLLIGDIGQRDPELYRDFAVRHPERIEAIYIRDIGASDNRAEALRAIENELASLGIPLIVARETEELASDARERGIVRPQEGQGQDAQRLAGYDA